MLSERRSGPSMGIHVVVRHLGYYAPITDVYQPWHSPPKVLSHATPPPPMQHAANRSFLKRSDNDAPKWKWDTNTRINWTVAQLCWQTIIHHERKIGTLLSISCLWHRTVYLWLSLLMRSLNWVSMGHYTVHSVTQLPLSTQPSSLLACQ